MSKNFPGKEDRIRYSKQSRNNMHVCVHTHTHNYESKKAHSVVWK